MEKHPSDGRFWPKHIYNFCCKESDIKEHVLCTAFIFFHKFSHIECDLHVFPDQEMSKPKTEKNKIKIIKKPCFANFVMMVYQLLVSGLEVSCNCPRSFDISRKKAANTLVPSM